MIALFLSHISCVIQQRHDAASVATANIVSCKINHIDAFEYIRSSFVPEKEKNVQTVN